MTPLAPFPLRLFILPGISAVATALLIILLTINAVRIGPPSSPNTGLPWLLIVVVMVTGVLGTVRIVRRLLNPPLPLADPPAFEERGRLVTDAEFAELRKRLEQD